MSDSEEQVELILVNANQALNFLRKILDDLAYKRDGFILSSQDKILLSQEKYKRNKAVLVNIGKLLKKKEYPLPQKLLHHLARNLRSRISAITEEAITLDKLR